MDGSPEGDILLLILLLVLAAVFACTEAAFLALSRTRVRQMREQHLWASGLLDLQHRNRPLTLTVLLLGITFFHYMAERVATVLSVGWLGAEIGPLTAVVVMTVVIIVFCEVVPIQIGISAPDRIARPAAGLMAPLGLLLLPVVLVLSLLSRGLLYLCGVRTGRMLPGISEDHLKAMIEESEEQGVLEAGERRMMHGVLDFGDRTAAQIMTPRRDMIAVDGDQPVSEALELGLQHHHSRLPVYQENVDNIIGVLHLKDLLPYLVKGDMDRPAKVVARCAHHVAESLPADELLRQLQKRRHLLAIVKDEYGGTAGLVTVEDVLEEIVGDIVDEYDVEEPQIVPLSETELRCDARVGLHELEHYVNQDLPVEDYDSLGGLLLDVAGHIPVAGETFTWGRLTLTVEAVTGPRLEKIRVTMPPPEPPWQPEDGEDDD